MAFQHLIPRAHRRWILARTTDERMTALPSEHLIPMPTLISIPAGKLQRRGEDSKWVDAQPTKGELVLSFDESDELLWLRWRTRPEGRLEDEFVLFEGEVTFEKVAQDPSGRTHVLKFASSGDRHFYWFQRQSSEGDARFVTDLNELIKDPQYTLGSAPIPQASSSSSTMSTPQMPGAPRPAHAIPVPLAPGRSLGGGLPEATASPLANRGVQQSQGTNATPAPSTTSQFSQEQVAALAALFSSGGGLPGAREDAHLTDVLAPSAIQTLLNSHPSLLSTLPALLPPGLNLPANPKASDLAPVFSSPQFHDAVASLDSALRNGGLPGGMMQELGLPEGAGAGVTEFLEALRALGPSGAPPAEDDRMDTD